MDAKYNIQDFIYMYYLDCNIPVYLYRQGQMVFCVPEQTELTFPPKKYTDLLFSNKKISYISTEYGVHFGGLVLDEISDSFLIFGPVGDIPFEGPDLVRLYKDYVICASETSCFQKFIGKIPQISLTTFITKLAFINYCLYGEKLSIYDFLPIETTMLSDASSLAEEGYQKNEDFMHNRSYEIEGTVLNLIRSGNPDGFREIQENIAIYNVGITGSTALQQLKNAIIITTTLSTRAAIDGGLDYDTAYQLSDRFLKSANEMQNINDLYALLSKIGYTFAKKVYEIKLPTTSNDQLQKAIQFIQQNTNRHITVADVAGHVGFSRSYFSAYFKKELGFSVGAFIARCKLEEGRKLLQYTNKPLSTISNYLCFASQSHFQTSFKKQFGVTPMQYRKNPILNNRL